MLVAIIDHGSGNLRSAAKAVERAGRDRGLAVSVEVTSAPEQVGRADRVVLPGVGAFSDCRQGLVALDGMVEALRETVLDRGRPLLGICVGMQLLATVGHEHRDEPGLDWIPGEVTALAPGQPGHPDRPGLKVPHMGWNDLRIEEPAHPLLAAIRGRHGGPVHAYFVHSYQFEPDDPNAVWATVDYGGPVTAAVGRDNLFGTQFHPEKSQAAGLALLGGFLEWCP